MALFPHDPRAAEQRVEGGLDVGESALEDLGEERSGSVVVGHASSVARVIRVLPSAGRRRVTPVALQFLTEHEYEVVQRIADRLLPAHGEFPGGGAAGTAEYVDMTLGAFNFDPPRIWAGGPYSGRHGGAAGFDTFLPLSRVEELAWRTRIEGSRGIAEREWNGPVRGWQEIYREGIAALGDDLDLDAQTGTAGQLRCFRRTRAKRRTGAPEYGGNRDLAGWRAIGYAGDVQPRGWSDAEVTGA